MYFYSFQQVRTGKTILGKKKKENHIIMKDLHSEKKSNLSFFFPLFLPIIFFLFCFQYFIVFILLYSFVNTNKTNPFISIKTNSKQAP